jgi:hypothetical protein
MDSSHENLFCYSLAFPKLVGAAYENIALLGMFSIKAFTYSI